MLDEKEKAEFHRDISEYLASFQNYQTVKAIKDARENRQEEEQFDQPEQEQMSSDDAFFKQLKEMGINLDPHKVDQAKNSEMNRQVREEESQPRNLNTRQQLQQDIARVIHSKE